MTGQEIGELVVKLVTALVPLGMLYIGYRTLRLAYQNTNAHFRQKLYEKQMDGATQLYAAVENVTDKALGWVFTRSDGCDAVEHLASLEPTTKEASEALARIVSKCRLCMPSDVNAAVLEHTQILERATNPKNAEMIAPMGVTPVPLIRLMEADFRVLQRLRACIGTDTLSDAVRKSLGALPKERSLIAGTSFAPPHIEIRDLPAVLPASRISAS